MNITPFVGIVQSHKTGRLSPSLTVEEITIALSVEPDAEVSSDGKVTKEWQFVADGRECAIWDYKGAKWSTFGPDAVFEQLFGQAYQPFTLAW